jgi:serine/threonine protein kinase
MMPEANCKFMQPIAPDTILQQRYRLMRLIGEGGFGRTYLATDQSRFGEQCAIKELSVSSHSRSRLSKAREFFKQEAALLYQLQHPQIPRFWATFEERDRMFLVQDYIPGRTYDSLLLERNERNQTFTEAEVWRFLLQILPVLGYIHSQGVVHQDISADNIILRESDMLPVLIDFGVVKQLANRLQGEQTGLTAVNVGKAGYAPVEQLSSGYAYPNSDLYSLAVTAVVLLTGRQATELFNEDHINWAWRNWVNVSDGLVSVLGKMLSYQPTERYQSAVEVFQALQSLSIPVDRAEQTQPLTVQPTTGQRQDSFLDEEEEPPTTTAQKVYEALTKFDTSRWERPQFFIPLFLVVALSCFSGGLAVMNYFTKKPTPVAQPVASASPSTSSQPLVSSKNGDGKKAKSIELIAGETTVKSGQLAADSEDIYEFYGTQGQEITLEIDNKNLLITVLGSNSLPVDSQAIRTPTWNGRILATGKHTLQVKQMPGVKGNSFDYRIKATLALVPSSPKASASPIPSVVQPSSQIINTPSASETPAAKSSGTVPGSIPIAEPSGQIRSVPSQESTPTENLEPRNNPSFIPDVSPSSEPKPSSTSAAPTVTAIPSSSSSPETLPPVR